ncbi:hypothetical protein POM88_000549 [Heracleum sosnowskyi]|uniref:Uncharacterized protein n=1 Tax=Heracleum sosnowskyi TaxID=360622 RepID=A0AAD8JBD6_9APIA|nr:hypothetical protein POM88_000549 [Heracleum sosnowskyi]
MYLGVPIGNSHKKKAFWNPVVQKVENRMASWKAESLNEPGRLVLIKSVLDGLPVYLMSLFRLPKGVVNQLESIRNFFLGSRFKEKCTRMHLVNWKSICRSKKHGGLGLVSIDDKNEALMGKWINKWYADRNRG